MKSMKLISFKFGSHRGWESQMIFFSEEITVITGENESGKSPMMNGIAYALGHKRSLPVEISENCDYTEISVEVEGLFLTFRRSISSDFIFEIFDFLGNRLEFFKGRAAEGDFGEYFFNLLSLPRVSLTSKGSKEKQGPAPLYASHLVPIFFISQLKGWSDTYSPVSSDEFIQNLYSEVMRLMLDLPAMNSFNAKQESDQFYKKREKLKLDIVESENRSNYYFGKLGKYSNLSEGELAGLCDESEQAVKDMQSSIVYPETAEDELNTHLSTIRQRVRSLGEKISSNKIKIFNLNSLHDEIEKKVEIEVDNFDSEIAFEKFCGNVACTLFSSSKVPFGKKVLYLRDQAKGFKDSIASMHADNEELISERDSLRIRSEELIASSTGDGSKAKGDLSKLRKTIEELVHRSEILEHKKKHSESQRNASELRKSLDSTNETISLFKGSKKAISEKHFDLVGEFQELLKNWLTILSIKNTNVAKLSVNSDFEVFVNGVKFSLDSQQEGSARVRIILAFHASLLELSLKVGANHPLFVLMDTPRREEIDLSHLENYFLELRNLNAKYKKKIQIVVAYKDPIFALNETDIKYTPSFETDNGFMYLGPKSKLEN